MEFICLLGIPARLGYADVRNHLSTPRMLELMQTDNRELCEKFCLQPLEFDGQSDSVYHPFNLDGNRHMEYLNDRGWFDDMPIDLMRATFEREYPDVGRRLAGASFENDVAEATG